MDIDKYIRALPEEEQRPYLLKQNHSKVRKAILEASVEKNGREGLEYSEDDKEEEKE